MFGEKMFKSFGHKIKSGGEKLAKIGSKDISRKRSEILDGNMDKEIALDAKTSKNSWSEIKKTNVNSHPEVIQGHNNKLKEMVKLQKKLDGVNESLKDQDISEDVKKELLVNQNTLYESILKIEDYLGLIPELETYDQGKEYSSRTKLKATTQEEIENLWMKSIKDREDGIDNNLRINNNSKFDNLTFGLRYRLNKLFSNTATTYKFKPAAEYEAEQQPKKDEQEIKTDREAAVAKARNVAEAQVKIAAKQNYGLSKSDLLNQGSKKDSLVGSLN